MDTPQMLKLDNFRFKDKFVGLTDAQVTEALQIVNAQFSGVYTLWSFLPPSESRAKRELCINYLVAWQLVQLHPDSAVDVSGTGGLPIKHKKAGPVSISYRDTVRQSGSGLLEMLTTNSYGIQALSLIQSAPEMYMVYA